ncbi:unnamed protein product [Amoebophrya sp. A120]|nr:unnamed protein product [Amoebophrya sp. A120]|eukprot:GSA120T00020408001.1
MAATARSKEEVKEFFDDPAVLEQKIKEVAVKMRKAKFAIAFTGAGISTAAGIPDFRSGMNTVLPTGPGKWEKDANAKKPLSKQERRSGKTDRIQDVQKAFPTFTHMALKAMLDQGVLKHLVSQNTDGLHLRSGVDKAKFSELHGNRNLEICKKCKRKYLRDFRTRTSQKVHSHETGRFCDNSECNGQLLDSIINFGENLPMEELESAENAAVKADFCLALGSSLTVTPAADIPKTVGEKQFGDLFIANLQKTPLDKIASSRLQGYCDEVMRLLCKEMGVVVPKWKLVRGLRIVKVRWNKDNAVLGRASMNTKSPPAKLQSAIARLSSRSSGRNSSGSTSNSNTTATSGRARTTSNPHGSVGENAATASEPFTPIANPAAPSLVEIYENEENKATKEPKQVAFEIQGWDLNTNGPYSLFKQVEFLVYERASIAETAISKKWQVAKRSTTTGDYLVTSTECMDPKIQIRLTFQGHYSEPVLVLPLETGPVGGGGGSLTDYGVQDTFYRLELDFDRMEWGVGVVGR